jgi:hypothetical protein
MPLQTPRACLGTESTNRLGKSYRKVSNDFCIPGTNLAIKGLETVLQSQEANTRFSNEGKRAQRPESNQSTPRHTQRERVTATDRHRNHNTTLNQERACPPQATHAALWRATPWPWDGLKLSHARMRPGSNPGLPRATSRLFARAPGRVRYWVSGGFPFTNCMCIPPRGARPKLSASMA